ncbi:hypothetical protein ANN_22374 [Periplaneta americana]|uniref:Uncharacterized protein n=1 Tax=Periplaneta americana TaxID=6978 RepID=A0ABQ8S7Z5_PERAM|nr:hypothetical protein ANN_22374 [Periplaneta americana]
MDLREVGYDDRDWINLAQDRDRWRAYKRAKTAQLLQRGVQKQVGEIGMRPDVERSFSAYKVILSDTRRSFPFETLKMNVVVYCSSNRNQANNMQEKLTGTRYQDFLINVLPTLLEYVPCQRRLQMWFMHDGTTAHFLCNVREHLTLTLQDRWVDRGGPTPWTARSPNLNPLDFWLCSVPSSASNGDRKVNKRRTYSVVNLQNTVKMVLNDNWTIYKPAKECGVPWSTLKVHISRNVGDADVGEGGPFEVPKLRRPFMLPVPKLVELRLVKYIIEMQELGFGLNVTQIKRLGFELSKATSKTSSFNEDREKQDHFGGGHSDKDMAYH